MHGLPKLPGSTRAVIFKQAEKIETPPFYKKIEIPPFYTCSLYGTGRHESSHFVIPSGGSTCTKCLSEPVECFRPVLKGVAASFTSALIINFVSGSVHVRLRVSTTARPLCPNLHVGLARTGDLGLFSYALSERHTDTDQRSLL